MGNSDHGTTYTYTTKSGGVKDLLVHYHLRNSPQLHIPPIVLHPK
jgi:hypothetical protein